MPSTPRGRSRLSRLAQMSWDEVRTRAGQELAKRGDELRYRLGFSPPGARLDRLPRSAGRFFFAPDELPAILQLLRERLPEQARAIVEEAERICRHQFDLLGYQGLDYGPEIDWHLDAVHGKRAPRKVGRKIRYLDFGEAGDHKIIWELNRHQHLMTLAKAYQLTQEERFAAELLRQWHDWQRQNPYPVGINWASSLEVALRSLSWIWVKHLLVGCPLVTAEFELELRRALALNGRHIVWNFSTYFSANTHLLGEAVALFFIGALDPELPSASRWQRRSWEIILQEARRQVRPDGLHFEQSFYYHVYALDFFLHARILAAANGIHIPEWFDETLVKMLEVLQPFGYEGDPTRFGDDDGGRVFNPRRNRAQHLLDPLATGAVLFRRASFKAAAHDLPEETLWLLGAKGAASFDGLETIEASAQAAGFKSSGIYVMADTKPELMTILAGSSDSGTGGHAHADALSVHLAAYGREWLTDPGTFCYISASDKEREAFRSTSAHNTLEVDSLSQADPAGPFGWQKLSKPTVEKWIPGDTFDLFAGSHRGYGRLPNPVEHTRWVFHLKPDFWFVRDVARGSGIHRLDLRWHLAPGLTLRKASDHATIAWSSEGREGQTGAESHELAFLSAEGHGWREQVTGGQFSPAYGAIEPSAVLNFGVDSALPAEFALLLCFHPRLLLNDCGARVSGEGDEASQLDEQLGRLTRIQAQTSPPAISVYRYNSQQGEHLFFFAGGSQGWKFGTWASDAQFLYFGALSGGDKRHLILCGGSYLEVSGQRLVDCCRPVERIEWLAGTVGQRFSCSDEQAVKQRMTGLPGPEVLLGAES